MAKPPDPRQPSFPLDRPRALPRPGSLSFNAELRSALARAIKECPKSRAIVAGEMTDLIYGETAGEGAQVTVDQLNSWTAPSRDAWRFPLEYLPAFVEATAAQWLLEIIAERCGCRALMDAAALLAEIAAIDAKRKDLKRRRSDLERLIDPSAAERLLQRRGGRP